MSKIFKLWFTIVVAFKKFITFITIKIISILKYRKTVTAAIICHEQNIDNIKKIIECQTKQPDKIVLYYSNKYFGDISTDWDIIKCPDLNDWGHGKCKQAIEEAITDFICFLNADSHYEPTFLEEMMKRAQNEFDVVLCDFKHRPECDIIVTQPIVGGTDRGNILVSVRKAQEVGYNHTKYEADGLFIQDLIEAGATWSRVDKCLFINK